MLRSHTRTRGMTTNMPPPSLLCVLQTGARVFVRACADLTVRVPSGTIYVPASEHTLNFSSTLNFSVGKKSFLFFLRRK